MTQQKTVKPLSYIIISFLVVCVALPFLSQAMLIAAMCILETTNNEIDHNSISAILLWCLSMILPLGLGYLYGKKKRQPQNVIAQYGPTLFPLIYTLIIWCIAMLIGHGAFADGNFTRLLLFGLPSFFLLGFFFGHNGFV